MKLDAIYRAVVAKGINEDSRGKDEIERVLDNARKVFEKLEEGERTYFDEEKLENPYGDTRVLYGDPQSNVDTILCGIDMEVGELLLADRLREKGTGVDLVMAHHPEGRGYVNLPDVMGMQADIWNKHGVGIGAADAMIGPRSQEVRRRLMPVNHYRAVDAAALLDIPMMCCHTPADNCVNSYVERHLSEQAPATLGALVKSLRQIPEYDLAARKGNGPVVLTGGEGNRVGKIFVDMTGGTSGPVDALNRLSQAGIDTIVGMHAKDEHRARAEELKMNIVIAGHMSSDALGMNLILDDLVRQGVKVVCTSGMTRVDRTGGEPKY